MTLPIDSALLLASLLAPAYALVLASPGPNLLVVLRASLRGSGPAAAAACGIACGAGGAALAAALLASCLLGTAAQGPHAVEAGARLVFAALLAHMGWRSLRRAFRGPATPGPDPAAARMHAHFRLGLAAALSNPLSLPFFLGFFLGHPEARGPVAAPLACALVMGMAGAWFGALGLAAAQGAWRGRPGGARWPEAAIGTGLLLYAGLTLRGFLT